MNIEWSNFQLVCKEVAVRMMNAWMSTDGIIVALGRGGYVPGVCLSHLTGMDLETVKWQTRDGATQEKEKLRNVFSRNKGRTVFIVDDINDTGETFQSIMSFIHSEVKHDNLVFPVAMYSRIDSKYKEMNMIIGSYLLDQEYLDFPWEMNFEKTL